MTIENYYLMIANASKKKKKITDGTDQVIDSGSPHPRPIFLIVGAGYNTQDCYSSGSLLGVDDIAVV